MLQAVGALLATVSATDPDARRDAEVILCHLLNKRRSFLFAFPEYEPPPELLERFDTLWNRRQDGEPVAYLIGRKEFWSLELEVGPQTLVPRPDTEVLVQAALDRLPDGPFHVLDLGTGSGAIALALAVERPNWTIIATDMDQATVELAGRNAARNAISNVEVRCGSWFEPVAGSRFDQIVSNPPYIAEADPWLQSHGVKFEPLRALVSGADGLDDIRLIVDGALSHLNPGGWLMLEHGYEQAAAVGELFSSAGLVEVETVQDIAGLDRVTLGLAR